MLALYPPFLAAALQTKLTRPFADKRVRIGLGVVAVVFVFAVLFSPLEIGATLLYLMLSLGGSSFCKCQMRETKKTNTEKP